MHSATKVAKHFVDLANANGCNNMTVIKLIKIVYVAHGWMLGLHARPLVSEDIEAWKYGPVIPELYRDIKKNGRGAIQSMSDDFNVDLDDDEQSIVEQTYTNYGSYDTNYLIALTHQAGTPWYKTWHDNNRERGGTIPNEAIQHYYANLYEDSQNRQDAKVNG